MIVCVRVFIVRSISKRWVFSQDLHVNRGYICRADGGRGATQFQRFDGRFSNLFAGDKFARPPAVAACITESFAAVHCHFVREREKERTASA